MPFKRVHIFNQQGKDIENPTPQSQQSRFIFDCFHVTFNAVGLLGLKQSSLLTWDFYKYTFFFLIYFKVCFDNLKCNTEQLQNRNPLSVLKVTCFWVISSNVKQKIMVWRLFCGLDIIYHFSYVKNFLQTFNIFKVFFYS